MAFILNLLQAKNVLLPQLNVDKRRRYRSEMLTSIAQVVHYLLHVQGGLQRSHERWKNNKHSTVSKLPSKRIRDNKRRHSAGFAQRLKYWAHCTTRYVSMVTYLVVTSPGCIRPRTFVFMQCHLCNIGLFLLFT